MRAADVGTSRVGLLLTCVAIAAGCSGASTSLTPDGFLGGSSGSHRASGRVSIAISIDGSADRTQFNQLEHKSELVPVTEPYVPLMAYFTSAGVFTALNNGTTISQARSPQAGPA